MFNIETASSIKKKKINKNMYAKKTSIFLFKIIFPNQLKSDSDNSTDQYQ